MIQRHIQIILIRMEALKAAIVRHNYEEIEFQYDRVLRAVTKLKSIIPTEEKTGKRGPCE